MNIFDINDVDKFTKYVGIPVVFGIMISFALIIHFSEVTKPEIDNQLLMKCLPHANHEDRWELCELSRGINGKRTCYKTNSQKTVEIPCSIYDSTKTLRDLVEHLTKKYK